VTLNRPNKSASQVLIEINTNVNEKNVLVIFVFVFIVIILRHVNTTTSNDVFDEALKSFLIRFKMTACRPRFHKKKSSGVASRINVPVTV